MPRPPLLKGGGGGGAEVLCFIPPPREELLLLLGGGREMSGSDGRWERCSEGADLSDGEGEPDLPVGGRGAAARDPGGRRADLPTEPPAEPSDRRRGAELHHSMRHDMSSPCYTASTVITLTLTQNIMKLSVCFLRVVHKLIGIQAL